MVQFANLIVLIITFGNKMGTLTSESKVNKFPCFALPIGKGPFLVQYPKGYFTRILM